MSAEPVVIESPNRLLSRKEAAQFLGVSMPTLALWGRSRPHELPFIKIGRLIKYRKQDLEAFIVRNTVAGGPVPGDAPPGHREPSALIVAGPPLAEKVEGRVAEETVEPVA